MILRPVSIQIVWLLAQVDYSDNQSSLRRCPTCPRLLEGCCVQVAVGLSFSLRHSLATEELIGFPSRLQPWHGKESLFLGAGIKYKTIVFIHIQVPFLASYASRSATSTSIKSWSQASKRMLYFPLPSNTCMLYLKNTSMCASCRSMR